MIGKPNAASRRVRQVAPFRTQAGLPDQKRSPVSGAMLIRSENQRRHVGPSSP
jgi:hypothetical protein